MKFSKRTLKKLIFRHRHAIAYFFIILLTVIFLIPIATYVFFAKDLKDKDSIMNRGKTGLTLLDRTGKPFFSFYQPKDITYVTLDQIPGSIQNSVVASEDKNFYT